MFASTQQPKDRERKLNRASNDRRACKNFICHFHSTYIQNEALGDMDIQDCARLPNSLIPECTLDNKERRLRCL